MSQWSAIVLAGGRGSRLGGVEKSDLMLGEKSLLAHVLQALSVPVVVVGPERDVRAGVRFVLEEPRYGGPVAGLRAAIDEVQTPVVGLLAVDMPLAAPVLSSLVEQFEPGMEVLVPVRGGHDEYVCSVFTTDALRRALAECGDSMHSLFECLEVSRVALSEEAAELLRDVDAPGDLELLERNPLD